MAAIASEHFPWLAAGGLGASVVLVVALATSRDPASIATLEELASSEPATSATSAAVASDSARPESDSQRTVFESAASSPSERATTEPSAAPITEAQIDQLTTVPEAKALAERAPNDPRVLRKLAKLQAAASEPEGLRDAMITLKALFRSDEKLIGDRELQQLVLRGASAPQPAQDLAFEIMTTGMKTVGADLIFEVATGQTSSKQRALDLTKKEDFKKMASPPLKIAIELRDRAACERKPLLAEAEKTADKRALSYLTPMLRTKGCKLFGLGDCYECFGNRAELTRAINAINAR